jgi:hypothetical protein
MVQCERDKKILADYTVGGLTGRQLTQVERHLANCADCRRELAALQHTGELLTPALLRPAPERVWEGISSRLTAKQLVTHRAHRPAFAAALAFVVLLLALTITLLRPSSITAPTPVPLAESQAEEELKAVFAGHDSASWDAPLTDDAALGLTMASLEHNG